MGNCDTHVFLGSNSYKTVEYFSKALGEKTITRDSVSINRDKQYHRQGLSESDQVLGRALMTPDELRRMDNDECIIYEKGIKPVKARKYYYFESPMAKKLAELTLKNLDYNLGERGTLRKYNPYNPYVEETENTTTNDLKVDSLDDLFEDDDIDEKDESKTETNNKSNIQLEENNPEESKKDTQLLDFDFSDQETNKFKKAEDTAPILPQDDENEVFSVDVQKELEAKFDELFGPIDED